MQNNQKEQTRLTPQSPMISVIIPVFNAERSLPTCLKSIQKQVNQDFEVIIVDDGSTDNSTIICEPFIATDSRFRLFRQKNEGVSSARNKGLKYAKGKWILFADADDWLSPDYLNITEEESHYDIIQKSYIKEYPNNTQRYFKTGKLWSTKDKEELFRFFVLKRTSALWDKLISKKLTEQLNFDEDIHIGEDFIFFIELIQKTKSYILSPNGYYHYCIHQNSIMQQLNQHPSKSIQHYFSLIGHMEKATKDQILLQNLIARFNVMQLYRRRKYMNSEDKKRLRELFRSIPWNKLKYLDTKWKLKILYKKYSFLLFE